MFDPVNPVHYPNMAADFAFIVSAEPADAAIFASCLVNGFHFSLLQEAMPRPIQDIPT
jgi:hypothetical protein